MIRTRLDLTQMAFGNLLGVQRNSVSRWELRTSRPQVATLIALLRMAETGAEVSSIREALLGAGVPLGTLTADRVRAGRGADHDVGPVERA